MLSKTRTPVLKVGKARAARQGLVAARVLLAGVSAAGCRSSSSASAEAEAGRAASVTAVEGKEGIHQVALTADAAERIGLQTGAIRPRTAPGKPAVAGTLSVPLTAVLYDKDGATWVYVSTDTLAFQREKVTISGVDGELAVLTSGPAAGTAVVTVGAAELLGAEDGVPGE
jgi:hypothetical protein